MILPEYLRCLTSFDRSLIGTLNTTHRSLEREYIERPNCLLITLTGCDLHLYYNGCARLWQELLGIFFGAKSCLGLGG
ncbi:hypothetical protein [Microcoleus sp. Pol12B4]|uniref:hypothetical protein n=1 Tax=Microcoleus sp. Pol12B4 TaxID=3055395 RepID=UPI002FD497C6